MKCQAAVLRAIEKDWDICEIDLDPPRDGEVLVRTAVAGVCHTDDHFATGETVPTPEMVELMRPAVCRRRSGSRCSAVTKAPVWSKTSGRT